MLILSADFMLLSGVWDDDGGCDGGGLPVSPEEPMLDWRRRGRGGGGGGREEETVYTISFAMDSWTLNRTRKGDSCILVLITRGNA